MVCLVRYLFVISTSVIDCLGRFVPEMTYYVLSGTLNTKLKPIVVTAEALRAIIGSKSAISLQRGPVDTKFQVEGVAPTNHSFLTKLG